MNYFMGSLFFILAFVTICFVRFHNPQLTETQLFLQFMPQHGLVVLCVIFGLWYFLKGERR